MSVRDRLADRRGQAAAIIALVAVCLIASTALALDVGAAYAYRAKCESVMEAAALAAAAELPDGTAALAVARDITQANNLNPELLVLTNPVDGNHFKLRVSYADQRPTFLAKVIGHSSLYYAAAATAERGSPLVFNYALFSGSTLEDLRISGSTLNVTGDVHSNEDLRFNGATINVGGTLEAAGRLINNGSQIIAEEIITYAPAISTPQYTSDELRAMCAQRFSGDQHWSSTSIDVTGGIFVDGSLKLSSVDVIGQGCIIATGDVEICGTHFSCLGPTDAVCLCSLEDILIHGTSMEVQGVFYAPFGSVTIGGAGVTVTGSVVGDTINFSGSDPMIVHDDSGSGLLPDSAAKLSR